MRSIQILASFFILSITAADATARTVEPGTFALSGGVGPAFKLGSSLGASSAYLHLMAQGEYSFNKSLSGVADVALGLAGTVPLRLHLGPRYRFADLDLPISPYVQAQISVGRLYGVLGADLTYIGARLGGGADYFLTANLALGGLVAVDFGSTTGDAPRFYGTVDVFAYASYIF